MQYVADIYYNMIMVCIETPFGRIEYIIVRKKMKNIRIRITAGSKVVVSAPAHTGEKRIDDFVVQNALFIVDKLKEMDDRRNRFYPATYRTGDTFWHLGNETKLEIASSGQTKAARVGDTLTLHVPQGADYRFIKALFILWMDRQAEKVFTERAQLVFPAFKNLVKKDVRISSKNMLTRWGSINPKRHTISLSVHLLRCEAELIDYIIMHELCHFAHPNHSRAFYTELEKHCPDRKKMDKRLKVYGLVDF